MSTARLIVHFTFPTKAVAEAAAAQLRRGKAVAARAEQAGHQWRVMAECDYPDWALPHLESGCRAFATGLGGKFLGRDYVKGCHFTTAA